MKSLQNFTVKRNFHKNLSSYFLIGLLFFTSCQEIQEQPLSKDQEITNQKFDRLVFLSAVNKATKNYREEANKTKSGKNIRSFYENENIVEDYINNIASEFNSEDLYFQTIPEATWEEPYNGHIFENEAIIDKNILDPKIRMHIDEYENTINNLADQYEFGNLTDDQAINELKNLSKNKGNIIKSDLNIIQEEREDMADLFYTLDDISDDILVLFEDPSFEGQNLFLKKKFFRALVRAVIVAAVTAAVIYTGAALIGTVKLKSLYLGHKAGWAAITTKTAIGASGKMYTALTYGLGKGIIGAAEKWEKEWEGLVKEAKYAVKIAW